MKIIICRSDTHPPIQPMVRYERTLEFIFVCGGFMPLIIPCTITRYFRMFPLSMAETRCAYETIQNSHDHNQVILLPGRFGADEVAHVMSTTESAGTIHESLDDDLCCKLFLRGVLKGIFAQIHSFNIFVCWMTKTPLESASAKVFNEPGVRTLVYSYLVPSTSHPFSEFLSEHTSLYTLYREVGIPPVGDALVDDATDGGAADGGAAAGGAAAGGAAEGGESDDDESEEDATNGAICTFCEVCGGSNEFFGNCTCGESEDPVHDPDLYVPFWEETYECLPECWVKLVRACTWIRWELEGSCAIFDDD